MGMNDLLSRNNETLVAEDDDQKADIDKTNIIR